LMNSRRFMCPLVEDYNLPHRRLEGALCVAAS
jgi:hypothetical protein